MVRVAGSSTTVAPSEVAPRGLPGKRTAIMRAATRIFITAGYERANLDTIAAEAGVSKQTIYNHFGDKERLFVAVVDEARTGADRDTELDESLLTDPAALEQDLLRLGRQFLAATLDPEVSALRRLIIAEVSHHPQLHRSCGADEPQSGPKLLGWLIQRVAVLTAQGVLSADRPDRAAAHFVSQLTYEGQQRSKYGTLALASWEIDEICADATDLFLRAYRVAPAQGRTKSRR
ncbi:TetR/AcrR family transcriptional regulator [Dactylosporangium maewongense]|uniref:TetR/AcrR family transcriptional regulator n=2 Tax=Dactylosporangium maewongense TaxID=634393 RepID=A0ABN2CFU1_9ACTN